MVTERLLVVAQAKPIPQPEPEPEPEPAVKNAAFLSAQAHIKSTVGGEDEDEAYIEALRSWLDGRG